jgi:salicylate hydroxylase
MLITGRFGDVLAHVETTRGSDWGRSCVHRAKFLDELIKLVPEGTIEFSRCLKDIQHMPNGVELLFEDGTKACASAVICADGIKSCGRRILLGESDPNVRAVFTGGYVYRSLIPREVAVKTVAGEAAVNGTIYCGYGGYIITYPVEHGRLVNMVANKHREGVWHNDEWVLPGSREDMLKDFEGWGKPILRLLDEVKDPSLWAIFDSPPVDSFCKGRICLIGDAAHASSPHQGAGAAMAFEDAYIMSGLLGGLEQHDIVELVFEAFDEVRRPRSQKLVATSRTAELVYGFLHEGILDHLDKVKQNIETRWNWLWNVDLPAELERAKKIVWGRQSVGVWMHRDVQRNI